MPFGFLRRKPSEAVVQAALEFVLAEDKADCQRVFEEHMDLFLEDDDDVDRAFDDLLKDAEDEPGLAQRIFNRRMLLGEITIQTLQAIIDGQPLSSAGESDALEEELARLNQYIQAHPDDLAGRYARINEILPLVDREDQPRLWADLHGDRAAILLGGILAPASGDYSIEARSADVEQAISDFQKCASVRTRQTDPERWASVQNDLAALYLHRVEGNRAKNLERSISYLNEALSVYSREKHPSEWARGHYNLGQMFYERLRGDRAQNLEQSIRHYRLALEVDTRQASPDNWAGIINNLGLAYSERIAGDRAENLEQAIYWFEQVLQVRDRREDPVRWAATIANLGLAYSDRLRGDPAENLEQAIRCYEQSLQIRTRESLPEEWARTQSNLASAYLDRVLGDSDENIERAIAHLNNALSVRTRRAYPKEWADTHHNLGLAYSDREIGDLGANIEQAIQHYNKALEVLTPELYAEDWARTQNNLASAYRERRVGKRSNNQRRAADHYQNALQVYTREAFPEQWAMVHHNLGQLLAGEGREQSGRDIEAAAGHFRAALSVYTPEIYPDRHRQSQYQLGHMYFLAFQWEESWRAHSAALEASEHLYTRAATLEARQLEQTVSTLIIEEGAYALAKLARLEEAVVLLERGKARALAEALGRREAALAGLSKNERASFESVSSRLDELEAEARSAGQPGGRDYLTISAELRRAREELARLTAGVSRRIPDFMPQGLDYQEIAQLVDTLRSPLAFITVTEIGSLSIAVLPGQPRLQVVWLDEFGRQELESNLLDSEEGEIRYLHAISEGNNQSLVHWLETLWSQIRIWLLEPITDLLHRAGHREAILLPDGLLMLLPLAAMAVDEMAFGLAPSARALRSAVENAANRSGFDNFLAIGNPLPSPQPLAYAQKEAEAVAALFNRGDRKLLIGQQATRQAVVRALAKAGYLHFACHGAFDVEQPLQSGLMLAGQDRLTLREVLDGGLDLSQVRLIVLSACQTGITDFSEAPDEAIGFPAAFLQAGVPAVISTLWAVDDLSTMLLMERLYGLHIEKGMEITSALRRAQLWLRDSTAAELDLASRYERLYADSGRRDADAFRALRYYRQHPDVVPFNHPYYWAPFYFSGA